MGLFFDVTGNEWMRMLWSMVCSTIMFGIVGSVVANVFQLPDILESVRSIGVGMKDLYRIGMAKSGISYQNRDKEKIENEKSRVSITLSTRQISHLSVAALKIEY